MPSILECSSMRISDSGPNIDADIQLRADRNPRAGRHVDAEPHRESSIG